MTKEKKQEFTLKISQANRTKIVVLTYELALQYIDDAKNAKDREEFTIGVQHAKSCIEQLRGVLDYSTEIALYLYRIYNYISLLMDKAMIRNKAEILSEAEGLLIKLHDAFDRIAEEDSSEPVMQNIETVYSGLTYGRGGVAENVNAANRGYTI